MSNVGLSTREAFDVESEELPRTSARRTAAQAQARARTHAHAVPSRAVPFSAEPVSAAPEDCEPVAVATIAAAPVVRAPVARRRAAHQSASRAPRAAASYGSDRSRIDANGVRTIKIRGQATPPRRRPMIDASRPIARYDQHPDRAAQWALFLGVFMVVVAIVTGS